jgi:hypothetical protein
MKLIAFDETENFILKGVIENVEPEERPQAVLEYLEANLDNPTMHSSTEGELLLSTLDQLYDKLLTCDQSDLVEILQGEFKSFLFDETVYVPYTKQEIMEVMGKEEFKRTYGKPKKSSRKKCSRGTA